MKKRVNPWLIIELTNLRSEQRVGDPLFGALELSPQFMRRARRLYRLGRLHQLDQMRTQSLETDVFWDITVDGENVPDAVTKMEVYGEHISFSLEFFLLETIKGLVWKSVGESSCTTLEELECYCEEPGQIHFLEHFDLEEKQRNSFIKHVARRMLELGHWAKHESQLLELSQDVG